MTELIIHIDKEKEPFIAELVKRLEGSVVEDKKHAKKNVLKKRPAG